MNKMLLHGLAIIVAAHLAFPVLGHEMRAGSEESGAVALPDDAYGERLGTVRFPFSCNEAASRHARRGLALLHHMTYEGARAAFAAAAEVDADCAMAYWGQAMSFIHPLWSDPPSEATFEKGRTLVEAARSRGQPTEREQAFIGAVAAYYAQGWSRDEKANLAAFEAGWREVHERFPDDPEATAFHALAHMATADPADKRYEKQQRAAAMAAEVLDRIPDHPGAHHYVIHAYDYPPLAEKAVAVARSYGKIAPAVPHALHMPSHIFTRLGLWQDSIALNRRSAEAALKHPAGDKLSLHYLHALDYLAYAHLQRAEDGKAEAVLATIEGLDEPIQPHVASAYALAAVPARIALERQRWDEAARLEARKPEHYPWDGVPAMEAITHFARALGAAHTGDGAVAREALERLAELRDKTAASSAYWADQVEIQRLSALAWLDYQEGRQAEALETIRQAAAMEAATEKHPVTPGEVLPAGELLGDMLLDLGRHQEARAEYLAALERSPNRFNSLYGAARAAELAGEAGEAADYYGALIELAGEAGEDRERLQQARAFVAVHGAGS